MYNVFFNADVYLIILQCDWQHIKVDSQPEPSSSTCLLWKSYSYSKWSWGSLHNDIGIEYQLAD